MPTEAAYTKGLRRQIEAAFPDPDSEDYAVALTDAADRIFDAILEADLACATAPDPTRILDIARPDPEGKHPYRAQIVTYYLNLANPATPFREISTLAEQAHEMTPMERRHWLTGAMARAIALLRGETPEQEPEPEPQHQHQEVEMPHHTTDPYLAARVLDNILHSADGPTPNAIAQLATVGDANVARITRRALQRVAPDHLAPLAPSNIADHLTPSERAQWVQDAIDMARTMPIYPTEEDSDMPLDPTDEVTTAIAAGRNGAEMEIQHRQMLGKHLEVFAHLAEQDILNPGAEIDGLQAACVIAGNLLDLIEAEQHLMRSCQATVDAASAAVEE